MHPTTSRGPNTSTSVPIGVTNLTNFKSILPVQGSNNPTGVLRSFTQQPPIHLNIPLPSSLQDGITYTPDTSVTPTKRGVSNNIEDEVRPTNTTIQIDTDTSNVDITTDVKNTRTPRATTIIPTDSAEEIGAITTDPDSERLGPNIRGHSVTYVVPTSGTGSGSKATGTFTPDTRRPDIDIGTTTVTYDLSHDKTIYSGIIRPNDKHFYCLLPQSRPSEGVVRRGREGVLSLRNERRDDRRNDFRTQKPLRS